MAQHRWDTNPPAGSSGPAADPEDDPAPDALEEPARRRRWGLTLPAAVLAVCLLLGCSAAVYLLRDRSAVPVASVEIAGPAPAPQDNGGAGGAETQAAPAPAATTGSPAASGPATAPGGEAELVVHVAGAVHRPGVVRLPAGSRIVDAVDSAGGTAPDADLSAVNLAAVLEDGAMVLVPRIGEAAPPPAGTAGAPGAGSGGQAGGTGAGPGNASGAGSPINLNTADAAQLQELPRVGPVLAERIIAWRSEHGNFSRPEDLDAVPGIGEAMLAALLPLVRV